MLVLGLSCFYHDAAACLVRDGRIVAAAQEERFTRRKHDPDFPRHALAYCLREAGAMVTDLDAVAFYDKPLLKFERLLETYTAYAPRGLASFIKAMPVWVKGKLFTGDLVRAELPGYSGPLLYPEHHESHAASAFYPSPFERAAFLTTDGVGEWATTSYGVGSGADLAVHAEQHFPHSLGLLYSAFTYFCGFRVNSGEYKLMGLAPYGTPRYAQVILDEIVDLRPDGSLRLNLDFFDYPAGLRMTGRKMEARFGLRRAPEAPLTQRDMDLAASIQAVTEEAVLRMARHVRRETGERRLVMAGGVALNCVANGKLLRAGVFDDLWLQPAAGDAGGALGAALLAYHRHAGHARTPQSPDAMRGAYLGPAFSDSEVEAFLRETGVPYERLGEADLPGRVADLLAAGQAVGWFQGRMEFGPRALGNRSILADPRGRSIQRTVNVKVKFRESFRPFAPSVLEERAAELFDLDTPSPYMLLVADVNGAHVTGEGLDRLRGVDSAVPAVTHVDGSARVQTVSAETNPRFHALIAAFADRTGVPCLVNTSFNVRGEPIVCTPGDAYRCFRRTHLDALVLGPFLLEKARIPGAEAEVLTAEGVAAEYGLD